MTKYKESINRLNETLIWTHKIQRTYLEKLESRRTIFSIAKIIVSSITSAATLLCIILGQELGSIISAIFTLLSVIFSEILNKIETKSKIDDFKECSANIWLLRRKLLILCEDIKSGNIDEEIVKVNIENFNDLFNFYTKDLDTVPDYIVEIAARKLKDRKDEELDFFLLEDN